MWKSLKERFLNLETVEGIYLAIGGLILALLWGTGIIKAFIDFVVYFSAFVAVAGGLWLTFVKPNKK